MKCSNLFTKFAVLILLQGVTTVHAQGGKLLSSQFYFATVGFGYGRAKINQFTQSYLVAPSFDFNLQKGKYYYSIGINSVTEAQLFGGYMPNEHINGINAMVGKVVHFNKFFCVVKSGIAHVRSTERGMLLERGTGLFDNSYFQALHKSGIGVPIMASINWSPIRNASSGIQLFANINTVKHFYGIQLVVHGGRIRETEGKAISRF